MKTQRPNVKKTGGLKLKEQPEDFRVEECTDVVPGQLGPFSLYRLEKRGWTTPDALGVVRRRWQLDLQHVSYVGLKDRHAHTFQYLTIFHGPRRGLTQQSLTLTYLGQVAEPFTSKDISANRFQVTLRNLSPEAAAHAKQALDRVRVEGVPNYFDDQRFGSVGPQRQFMARFLVLGHYEDALRQALTAPYEYDLAAQKQEKALIQSHWGDWEVLKAQLPRGHARSLVDYLLNHPQDFQGAIERLRPELRGLYLSAFQSYLWNKMLALSVRQTCLPGQLIPIRMCLGEFPMHQGLTEAQLRELADLQLPLPSARFYPDPNDPRTKLMDEVLAEEGLQRDQFKLKGFHQMFFSKGERAALCMPRGLTQQAGNDERHPGKQKLVLNCELARGSYMTLIVKRITR
jgi:tRNA pseudouridine13 synthase